MEFEGECDLIGSIFLHIWITFAFPLFTVLF